jgi:hypothetical protein
MGEGLRLARLCKHEEAKWLVGLFPGEAPVCGLKAQDIFLAQGEDARALCFGGVVYGWRDDLIRWAAELGCALAQGMMANADGVERVAWAEMATAQKDPSGMARLALFCMSGEGCQENKTRGLILFKEAAELEDAFAQFCYGHDAFSEHEPERYVWLVKAACKGMEAARSEMAGEIPKQLKIFDNGGSGRIVFAIGAALSAVDKPAIFVEKESLNSAQRTMVLYDHWCRMAKEAIRYWIAIGARLKGINKDMRMLIARLLWAERASWSEREKDENM